MTLAAFSTRSWSGVNESRRLAISPSTVAGSAPASDRVARIGAPRAAARRSQESRVLGDEQRITGGPGDDVVDELGACRVHLEHVLDELCNGVLAQRPKRQLDESLELRQRLELARLQIRPRRQDEQRAGVILCDAQQQSPRCRVHPMTVLDRDDRRRRRGQADDLAQDARDRVGSRVVREVPHEIGLFHKTRQHRVDERRELCVPQPRQ